MVGSPNFPRLSRGIFNTLARESGIPDTNEIFDNILYLNRHRFLNSLQCLSRTKGR